MRADPATRAVSGVEQMARKIEIRAVDPAEAEHDVEVRYAFEVMSRARDGEGGFVPVDWLDDLREPTDRSVGMGAILHGALCRSGGCEADGARARSPMTAPSTTALTSSGGLPGRISLTSCVESGG
jgi:hypothetical protein